MFIDTKSSIAVRYGSPNHRGTLNLNQKSVAVAPIVIVVILSLLTPILPALGQTVGAEISQIFPADLTGVVGEAGGLVGSIDTRNGRFQVYFGSILVANGTSQDYGVTVNFRIPETPAGEYTVTLRDVSENNNATKTFTVEAAYYIEPIVPEAPKQLQEGSTVVLNITMTGGRPNAANRANITVTLPAPLSTNYSQLVTLPTTSQKGTMITQLTYPDNAFQPAGSLIDYAGSYKVYFNLTESLGSGQFQVGFTDLNQYHRGQTAKIRAIGYQSNETATIAVKSSETGAIMYSAAVTPSSEGIVTAEWAVPADAAIGNYDVTIAAENTTKAVPDSQVITVPGYPVQIRVIDLSGVVVPKITVEALDTAANKTYDGTTGADGKTSINLEGGRQTLTAFWNGLKVGTTNINVTGAAEFSLDCELTNLRITVQDRQGLLIPSSSLEITYQYVTTKDNQERTGSTLGQTGIMGTFTLNSTPPGINYTINASVYGFVFNSTTVNHLQTEPISDLTIICPARTLTFNILDYNSNPITNARIAMLELTAGIFYGSTTNGVGSSIVEATFGKYAVRVYTGSVLLNETVIEVFTDKRVGIQCVLFNLQVTVKVGDYFGQPIPNANVRIIGPEGTAQSERTLSDGTATFNKVTGGDMQIVAYLAEGDEYYEARNIHVESPTAIQVRMGRYIALGPLLVQTNQFMTIIVVVPTVAVLLFWEVYQKRKTTKRKNRATIENINSK